jgi:hypothetical protein
MAALGAALLIMLQLTAQHWFYLYIIWFYPLLLVPLASLKGRPSDLQNASRSGAPAGYPGPRSGTIITSERSERS